MVQSEHMRTLFDSTQSQESKSEVCAQELYVAMHIKTPFVNTLYLISLLSHQPVSYFLVVAAVFFFKHSPLLGKDKLLRMVINAIHYMGKIKIF